jgi:hypothetical protein
MDRRPSPTAVVLLAPRELAASLGGDAGFPSDVEGVPITLLSATADLRDELPAARGGRREVAILYVAADEETALLALEVGADEALDVASVTPTLLARALRRAVTRASTRLQAERVYGSAAHAEKLSRARRPRRGRRPRDQQPLRRAHCSPSRSSPYRLAPALRPRAGRTPRPRPRRTASRSAILLPRARHAAASSPTSPTCFDDMVALHRFHLRPSCGICASSRARRSASSRSASTPRAARSGPAHRGGSRISAASRTSSATTIRRSTCRPCSSRARASPRCSPTSSSTPRRPLARGRPRRSTASASPRAPTTRAWWSRSPTPAPASRPSTSSASSIPSSRRRRPGEGTGLGLALSSDLVRRMGGHILAESELERRRDVPRLPPARQARARARRRRPQRADRWVPSSYGAPLA